MPCVTAKKMKMNVVLKAQFGLKQPKIKREKIKRETFTTDSRKY